MESTSKGRGKSNRKMKMERRKSRCGTEIYNGKVQERRETKRLAWRDGERSSNGRNTLKETICKEMQLYIAPDSHVKSCILYA